MGRTCTVGIMMVGIMTVAIAAASAARAGDELPRYQLEPGMELSYKESSTFRHQNGMHIDDQESTAWIVRRNGDGSVRVVLRQGSRFTATSVVDTLKSLFKKQAKPPMDYHFGYFDVFPDGRLGPDAELSYRITPASLFPRLPDDEAKAKAGWGQRHERMGQEYRYSSLRAEPSGWLFRAERIGPENKVYGMTMDSTVHFDAKRGAIRRIEQEYARDYGFKGKGSGSMELTAVETRDAAWLASFAPAADRYFAASKAYERATEAASKDAAKADALLADAKAALKSARDAIDQPIFREQLDHQIAQHDGMAKYYADSAKRRADVVGKPAADWELKGLDGKTHALAGYRGKVLVLDFWYRGCGWCIKAMPQLNALAEDFAERPVAVLGMNTDGNEADAKFVADAMGLKYATLRAKGIPEKYGVQGFPTLILIDREGKVRDMHVGYSPTLRAELAKAIEGLLPSK
ncbi:MAG TPA: TlpA disulfide reductase family protein [Isosphaeraceae bacterium]|nr:TlpA disulfide reductase family protein [Isosphaeraceae bacterium]